MRAYCNYTNAKKAAKAFMRVYDRPWCWITKIVSGMNIGQYCVTPDKLDHTSVSIER